MQDQTTLAFILLQLLALLLVVACVLGLVAWRFRKRYRRLMRAYVRLKKRRSNGGVSAAPTQSTAPESDPAPGIDWAALQQDALDRYRKSTGKTLGDFNGKDPFSARIASIRYLYLKAEAEAEHADTPHRQWQMLEKALAGLVTTLLQNMRPVKAQEQDTGALMKQRIHALQHVEQDNVLLRAKNENYGAELKKLRNYQQKYRALLAQLDAPKVAESREAIERSGLNKLSAIHDSHEQVVQRMHRHVKGEPHEAFYQDKKPLMGHLQELHDGVEEYREKLGQYRRQLKAPEDQDTRLSMIRTLRDNNQAQRNTIVDLRRELKCLQRAMVDEQRDPGAGDTVKLERMVSECEACIATLESEVQYLHDQLDSRVDTPASTDPESADFLTTILLGFALAVIEKHSFKDVLALVRDTLVQLNIQFALRQCHGAKSAEINTTGRADAVVSQQLLGLATGERRRETDAGLEYANTCLQVIVPKDSFSGLDAETLIRLLDVIHGLVHLQLDHLADLEALERHHQQVVHLAERVRAGVTNIDIQYAYNTEETKRVVDNLIIEMRQLVTVLDVDDDMRSVFEAAITEAKQRFVLLYDAGSAVDREISALSQTLDELEK